MRNTINWFEIPATDMERAVGFYEKVLEVKLKRETFGGLPLAILPAEDPGVAGALVKDPKRPPVAGGPLVYLNANGRLDRAIRQATEAGGAVLVPKTDMGEVGAFAIIRDTEGNHVGLHAERA